MLYYGTCEHYRDRVKLSIVTELVEICRFSIGEIHANRMTENNQIILSVLCTFPSQQQNEYQSEEFLRKLGNKFSAGGDFNSNYPYQEVQTNKSQRQTVAQNYYP